MTEAGDTHRTDGGIGSITGHGLPMNGPVLTAGGTILMREDGYRYYLNPVDDGSLGAMRVGWQIIGGKAYYFNGSSDGTYGALLTNTTTPDGYRVGADGAMVR